MEESRRKAVRKRQSRRKSESVQRRKNVVVNRREVNNVASVFRISSEICRHILRMSKGADGEEDKVNNKDTDSYLKCSSFVIKAKKIIKNSFYVEFIITLHHNVFSKAYLIENIFFYL